MDDYQELIERLRDTNKHTFALWFDAADAIESLLAENERLKHNLTSTEQTMREYQELAAKRLEEIAKYRDAPVVGYIGSNGFPKHPSRIPGIKETHLYGPFKPLIVKPGEEK